MKKPLSRAIKTFYGIGDFTFSIMAAVEMYAFTFFLTNVAMFPLATSTIILLITSTVDAILSPIYGGIINAVKAMKWGRYRSWLLICPPFVVVFYALTFTRIGSDLTAAVIICTGFILSHIIWNIAWVANVSLISVLASNGEERALLASRRGTYTSASRLVTSYTSMPFALFLGSVTKSPVLGFTLVAGIMAFAMMIGYYIHFIMTKGYEPEEIEKALSEQSEKKDSSKAGIGEILKNLFKNPPLIFLMLADFSRFLAVFIMSAILAYYYQYVIQDMSYFPTYILASAIMTILGAYLAAFLCKKLSTRTTSIIAILFVAILMFVGKLVAYQAIPFIVVMSFGQFFMGILSSSMVALYGDTVVYAEWKTGKNTAAFIMGLMNFPLKIAIVARSGIIGAALAAYGFSASIPASEASMALRDGIVNVFVMIPGVGLTVSFLILLLGFRLTKEKLDMCSKEIEERKVLQI